MSKQVQASSLDHVTSAFVNAACTSGPNVWADAGAVIEAANRTQRPVGWRQWSLAAVLLAVVLLAAVASACAW